MSLGGRLHMWYILYGNKRYVIKSRGSYKSSWSHGLWIKVCLSWIHWFTDGWIGKVKQVFPDENWFGTLALHIGIVSWGLGLNRTKLQHFQRVIGRHRHNNITNLRKDKRWIISTLRRNTTEMPADMSRESSLLLSNGTATLRLHR